jgi:DNA-binding IclR family transcriptional regulator
MLPHNGTIPSVLAAHHKTPTAATDRAAVLEAIRRSGDRGLTREEIAGKTGCRDNSVRPRCVELRRAGLIKESGRFGLTASGSKASVLVMA